MINYVNHNKIDRQKWDKCISSASFPLIYGYSWYLDITCNQWDAIIEDDYKSVFPVCKGRKYGFDYVYQPPFVQQGGLFTVNHDVDIDPYLDLLLAKYKFVEININSGNKTKRKDVLVTRKEGQFLELSSDYNSIYNSYSSNAKRDLNKAIKNELSVCQDISISEIVNDFGNMKGKDLNISNKDLAILLQLFQYTEKNDLGFSRGVCDKNGNICATAYFFKSDNRLIYAKGTSTNVGRKYAAMRFLMDSVIREYAGTNYIYDFGGSSVPSVAAFNRRFGAKNFSYLHLKQNKLPSLIKLFKP